VSSRSPALINRTSLALYRLVVSVHFFFIISHVILARISNKLERQSDGKVQEFFNHQLTLPGFYSGLLHLTGRAPLSIYGNYYVNIYTCVPLRLFRDCSDCLSNLFEKGKAPVQGFSFFHTRTRFTVLLTFRAAFLPV
jgi:hypothetical protein